MACPTRCRRSPSRNPHKMREILEICADWPVEWVTAERRRRAWPDVEETGETYLENALLKARAVARALGAPGARRRLGDRGGRPRRRARARGRRGYAGEDATDEENLRAADPRASGVPAAGRTARYRCVRRLRVARRPARSTPRGSCEGTLDRAPRGAGRLRLRPVFVPAGWDRRWPSSRDERRTGSATGERRSARSASCSGACLTSLSRHSVLPQTG